MYVLIIFLPVLNSILLGFFGSFIGKRGTIILTIFIFGFAWALCSLLFIDILLNRSICEIILWKWLILNEVNLQFGLLFDAVSITMCLVVFSISSLVHFYAFGYMNEDPHFIRFIMFLSLFTFFMLLIVTANNFIQLFFGWECVGLASYLLINFWYTRLQANKSALKAIIVNKIGDLGVIAALISLFFLTKTFDYNIIFNLFIYYEFDDIFHICKNANINVIIFINSCLLLGVIAKSAQIGLHTWLVDAMEGPTPVSALLHAATMVTVGVFCLIRCNILFSVTPSILLIICFIGAITALFGSIVGLLQNDIKRVIAYSTCSQLGYMIAACGLNFNELALYHLVNHAFFKALLFLAAGAVIHTLNGKQDMRELGSLIKLQPIPYISFFIGSFALMGLPFFSGFFSKDLIIEFAYINILINNYYLWIFTILVIAAFFTAFYSVRLIYLTFFNEIKNVNKIPLLNNHKLPFFIIFPLICLSILSIVIGWILKDAFIGFGTDIFEGTFYLTHNFMFNLLYFNIEILPVFIKLLPNTLSLIAILIAIIYLLNHKNFELYDLVLYKTYININYIFQKKLFFDFFYYIFFIRPSFILSYNILYKQIDRGFFEIFGPVGITEKLFTFSKLINNLYKNNFYLFFVYLITNLSICISLLLGLMESESLFPVKDEIFFISIYIFYSLISSKTMHYIDKIVLKLLNINWFDWILNNFLGGFLILCYAVWWYISVWRLEEISAYIVAKALE